MTDIYTNDPFDPRYLEDSQRRQAAGALVNAVDDDPEDAAKAVNLGNATGVNPVLIHSDLEGFEKQQRVAVNTKLSADNKFLQDYLTGHPMAAAVSHDDLAQLDEVSEHLGSFYKDTRLGQWLNSDSVAKTFMEGFGDQPVGRTAFSRPDDIEYAVSHPLIASAASVPAFAGELIGRTTSGILRLGYEGMSQVFGKKFAREMAAMAEHRMMRGDMGVGAGGGGSRTGIAINEELAAQIRKASEAIKTSDIYTAEGKEPPANINPLLDEAHKIQAKEDGDALKELTRSTQASQTRERSPEMFAKFIESHIGNREIGIDADAIRRLYGDKVPAPDDGILGWVPGLAERLASPVGDDVRVPMKDWLAKVDPEVAKELHDDVRVRDGGLTINDTKIGTESSKPSAQIIEHPDSLRQIPWGENDPTQEPLGPRIERTEPIKWEVRKEDGFYNVYADGDLDNSFGHPQDAQNYIDLYSERTTGLRPHPGRTTNDNLGPETKQFHPEPTSKEVIPEPLQTVRGSAGLEPMFQVGDRKLTIGKKPPRIDGKTGAIAADEFDVLDETGKKVGWLEMTPHDGGKKVYVDNVMGLTMAGMGPNKFGPGLTRSLIQQIKQAYPQVEQIGGFRISGAREKAGTERDVWIKVQPGEEPIDLKTHEDFKQLLTQNWEEVHKGLFGLFHEEGKGVAADSLVGQMVMHELARIVPDAEADVAHGLQAQAFGELHGAYVPNFRQILVSLRATDPIGTARHEAIHALKDLGLFSDKEWATLQKASADLDWVKKYNIEERWAGGRGVKLTEESIAEAYLDWARGNDMPKEVHGLFERFKQFLEGLRTQIKELFGRDLSWEEIFQKVDSGEIGRRELPEAEGTEGEIAAQPADDGLYDRGKALGVTQAHMERMQKLIEQEQKQDLESAQKRIETQLRRLDNREWKERRTQLRDEVRESIEQRPDVAADRMFYRNQLKIDPKYLTEEQRSRLPKDYVQKKDGENPDNLAGFFGYTTGDALIERLTMLAEDRVRSGMTPNNYLNRLIDIETDRRLNQEFSGKESALDRAKEQALSETALNRVDEETLAYALKAGREPKFTLDDVKEMVRVDFDSRIVGSISSNILLSKAGTIGKKIEEAGAKGNWVEADRLSQRRQNTLLAAKLATQYEKARKSYDNSIVKKYAKRPTEDTAKRIDQDYYNFMQGLLVRFGNKIGRTAQQLAEAVGQGNYDTLKSLVESKQASLRELDMPPFLIDPAFTKVSVDDFTMAEFNQFHNFMKQMDFNARDEMKIIREGDTADLQDTIKEMISSFPDSLATKPLRIDRKENKAKETLKSNWWSMITVRSMAKRLDQGNPKGLFTRLVADRATEADARYSAMHREYMKRLQDIGKIEDMDKQVENDLFKDPNTGEPLLMRKRNVYGIISNWGNNSNRTKMLKGWDVERQDVEAWLRRNSTPEDFERAQNIGNIFNDAFRSASNMKKQVSGVGIDALSIQKFIDPHGVERKGWYNPVKYESQVPGTSKALLGANAVEQPGFFRSTTPPEGYAEARTGYIAPMEMNLDYIPVRLNQMLHDIAWRPALLDMSKLIFNQSMQRAIIAKYGKHQMEEFKSYVKDMANSSNVDSMAEYYRETMFEYFRRNTVGTLIGLNPSTVAKHGTTALMNSLTQVGPINFTREFTQMFRRTDEYADTQLMMAYNKSEVIQDRIQNMQRLIRGHDPKFNFEPGKFGQWREIMMQIGSFPVAISDFASAVPTWLAKYKEGIASGESEGFSVQAADKAVIEAHGSSMPSNMPSIMREGGAMTRMFSSLYGFFSHMLQKQYEFAWKAKDIWNGDKPLDIQTHWAPHMAANIWSYWLAPAIIEELITPLSNNEHESWGIKVAKTLGLGASSSLLYVRDFARALLGTYGEPQAGLVGTSMKAGTDFLRDFGKPMNKEHAGKLIKDAVTMTGVATGLTNAQEGRSAEYIYRYLKGIEKPKGPWDVATGLRYGKTDQHSRTFDEWWKHMTK